MQREIETQKNTDQSKETENRHPDTHLFYPNFASHSCVERSTKVSVDGSGGGVDEDGRGHHGSPLRVKFTQNGDDHDEERDGGNVIAGTD